MTYHFANKMLHSISTETDTDTDTDDRLHSTSTNASTKATVPSLSPSSTKQEHHELEAATQPPIQDKGFKAWSQCVGGFAVFFSTWGMIGSFGVFQSYYQDTVLSHWSPSEISWIGSFQGALMLFGSIFVGPLYDRGYFPYLMTVGSFLIVLGIMLTSISTQYWHFILAQGLVAGIGMSLIFLPSLALLPGWFVRHRALAMSLASAGTGIGGILFPIIFNNLLPRIGFGWTVRVLAFIILSFLLLAGAVLRPRTFPESRRKLFDVSAWRDVPYVLLAFTSLLGYIGVYIPFFYMQVYAVNTKTASASLVPYIVPLMNVGYSIGRVVPGIIADRIGAFNTLAPCLLVSGIIAICWNAVHDEAGLIVFCLLFGLMSAPLGSLGPATIVSLTPNLSVVGVWMGMMFVPIAIGLLIGTPISGAILQEDNWLGLQVFCGCALIVSAVTLTLSRGWKTHWVLKAKL